MSARAFTAAGAAIAAVYLLHVYWLAGVAEDAFISFRYARNLADGLGFVWNPGELPVEGYTNFLWVLLAAGFAGFDADVLRAAQAVGAFCGVLVLVYAALIGRRLGWKREWCLLPMGLLAISGPLAAWAGAGLETLAFTLLVFASLYHAAEWARNANGADRFVLLLLLLLAVLMRPEGVLAAGVVFLVAPLFAPRGGRRSLAKGALVVAAVYALYFVWRWQYFGYLLPNTFYAKTGGGWSQVERGAAYLGYFSLHYVLPWAPALLVTVLSARVWPRLGPRLPFVPLATAFCIVWAGYVVLVGGDYMAMYRFVVPLVPPLVFLLALMLRLLVRSACHGGLVTRSAAATALIIGVVGTLVNSTPFEALLFDVPPRMHGNYRGIEKERWHVARLTRLADVFAGRAASADDSVATDAIGALGWHSGLRVHGAHGLVDASIAHQSAELHDVGSDYAGHDRRDLWRLFEKKPTYFMFTRELRATKPEVIEVPDLYAGVVAESYVLRAVWVEDPENGEAGWFPFLERRDAGAPGG